MPDKNGDDYRDCEFCNDVVAYGVEQRHHDGQLFHVDCLIRMLKDKIHELEKGAPVSKLYYFMSYRWRGRHNPWRHDEWVTQKHPVLWLVELNKQYPEEERHINFWSEISKEVYEQALGKLG